MCFDYPPQVPHFGADCAENRRIVFLNIHYEPLRSLRLCVKKIVLSVSKLFHSSKLFDISGIQKKGQCVLISLRLRRKRQNSIFRHLP
jgi:hypothetical protein